MLSVLSQKREGFRFYFALSLVNKCMNGFVPEVRTRDNWGVPLERFGFSREGEFFVSAWDKLKLPHDCEK